MPVIQIVSDNDFATRLRDGDDLGVPGQRQANVTRLRRAAMTPA